MKPHRDQCGDPLGKINRRVYIFPKKTLHMKPLSEPLLSPLSAYICVYLRLKWERLAGLLEIEVFYHGEDISEGDFSQGDFGGSRLSLVFVSGDLSHAKSLLQGLDDHLLFNGRNVFSEIKGPEDLRPYGPEPVLTLRQLHLETMVNAGGDK